MTGIKIGRSAANRITVSFPYNPDYIAKIKTIEGYRWHPEEKCWSLPSDSGILDRLVSLFEGERLEVDPSLRIEGEKTILLEDLRRELISRKYSPKTIKAYIHYNEEFLRFAKKSPADVVDEDIKNYLFYLADEKDSSASTLNIAINALKFYYDGIKVLSLADLLNILNQNNNRLIGTRARYSSIIPNTDGRCICAKIVFVASIVRNARRDSGHFICGLFFIKALPRLLLGKPDNIPHRNA